MNANTKTYAVTGATGQVGSQLARGLLARGQRVRVLTRDAAKVQDLVALGADAHVGSSTDAAYLEQAFRGVDAVFAMLPPDYGAASYRDAQDAVAAALNAALVAAGVRKVVNLSSNCAHLAGRVGPIKALHDQEQRLNALGIDVVHLRPAYFMENLAFTLEPLRGMGVVGSPLRADLRFPMVATADIAAAAAEHLLALAFRGVSVHELGGARDVTMAEVTAALAKAAGKALSYVQFPYAAAQEAMAASGLSADSAAQLVEMYGAMNDGYLAMAGERSARTTTGTSIEDFAPRFVRAHGV